MTEVPFRLAAMEERQEDQPRGRRLAPLGVALLVTVGGLGVALVLGTLGYDIRRSHMHDARLKGILVQNPTVYQVTKGLEEKAPLVLVVDSNEELLKFAAKQWGGPRREEILRKASEWPQLRIFAAGDMMYFIYFDASDIMRDYVYVSTENE